MELDPALRVAGAGERKECASENAVVASVVAVVKD